MTETRIPVVAVGIDAAGLVTGVAPGTRRPYAPPRLTNIGSVSGLTMGGSAGGGESGNELTRSNITRGGLYYGDGYLP